MAEADAELELSVAAKEEATEAAKEAVEKAVRMETDRNVVEEAVEKAVRMETDRNVVEEAAKKAARDHLGGEEAAARARRTYIAVYVDTYMAAALRELKRNLRSESSSKEEVGRMGYKFDNDGNITFIFGGKRKRRRTRRKK